ncbi:molybdate ABC transporter permease subunit [Terracidiphilus gabretensis]|jgi:molybdate transport system permease protein|uniref:molybdate ABC transporter permease subunit n=1 Tax=Terracidiphilus gabretensis TaxID=1577687 RepID=UPI00071BA3EF|nr:molybdate ABC transporter permease subunit [Terracidiphilus gabretensis]
MDWQALLLTLRLATLTTAILLVVAVPLAALLVLGRSRWLVLVEALTALPLVLPPTVLGFFLLVLLGPRTALGRVIIGVLGHPLAFSFSGLVVGSVIYSLPFAVQPITAGFAAVNPALVDAARLLGAGTPRLVSTVLLPLARRSIVVAAVLSFLHTVGEFGVVLMLGGDIPGATRTLSIVLYDQVESFDYAAAMRTAVALLTMSIVALVAIYATGAGRRMSQGDRRG